MLHCMYSEMFVVMVGYINESSTFHKKKKKTLCYIFLTLFFCIECFKKVDVT